MSRLRARFRSADVRLKTAVKRVVVVVVDSVVDDDARHVW